MRKCALFSVALLAALSFMTPNQAAAQSIFVGAGATIPMGDYADFGDGDGANTGYMGIAGITFPFGDGPLALLGEGFYGANSHDHDGDKTNLYGAMGGIIFDPSEDGEAGFYAFGQAGLMVHAYKSDEYSEYEDSETGFALGGGAGYGFPLGSVSAWAEGRYMMGMYDGGNTSLVGIMAGISIPIGG